jgi:hypothetical protein
MAVVPRVSPGAAAAPAPAPARPPAPTAELPRLADESTDDDIRTVMRTPEQMIQDEESHDAPRTVLLRDDDPLKPSLPLPAAGSPAAPPAQWADGPAPAPTMALPVHFEPASPGFPGGAGHEEPRAPEPVLAAFAGTQKIPPDLLVRGPQFTASQQLSQSVSTSGPGFPAPAQPGPQAGPFGVPPHTGAPLAGQQVLVLGAAPMPMPMPMQEASIEPVRSSKKGLVFAAVIALLVAAGLTFAFLKLKGL